MEILIWLFLIFVVIISVYYGVCHLIRLFTGCSLEEASVKLHNYVNGTVTYHFENDSSFAETIWHNVRSIIGEKQFEKLKRLSNTAISAPLLAFGIYGGLPTINICAYCDETEKQQLQTILSNIVKAYLHRYGYDTTILNEWKIRDDLKMPYLQIRYSKTKSERQLLATYLAQEQQSIIAKSNTTLFDDTDEEDLDE